jgi:hypothetical protein
VTGVQTCALPIFTDETVSHLPEPVKKYLSVCGYMNTPVPVNADVHWKETFIKMSPDKKWSKLRTLQFNSVNPIARIAFMKFRYLPVSARDIYCDGYGEMNIKLFNLFKIALENSREVAQSVLIIAFCEFFTIPGYLLSDKIEWEYIDDKVVRARLTDNGISLSGVFRFDDSGFLHHFETADRYYYQGKEKFENVKFSAVFDSYKSQGTLKIVEKAKVIWHLPEGDYEYYKGTVDKIDFNVVLC